MFKFWKNKAEEKEKKSTSVTLWAFSGLLILNFLLVGLLQQENKPKEFVLSDVPIMNQSEEFNCNVTAAAIALKYRGVDVDPMKDIYESLPKETTKKENGYWGNPHIGFVGNVYGQWGGDKGEGYGVYWEPISEYISKYRENEIKREWNLTDLLNEVENGNPSIIWWQNNAIKADEMKWKSYDKDGKEIEIEGVKGMHSEVVIGYVGTAENPKEIILSDPWASRWDMNYHRIKPDKFKELWAYFDNTAVLVK
jgi:uncharacterized protein YvpB